MDWRLPCGNENSSSVESGRGGEGCQCASELKRQRAARSTIFGGGNCRCAKAVSFAAAKFLVASRDSFAWHNRFSSTGRTVPLLCRSLDRASAAHENGG